MSKPAIVVDSLSKSYRIGQAAEKWPTFRDALVQGLKAPLRRLRRLNGGNGKDETFWALKDVSFEVQPGEVVGIIGRNGAGKSTLLKVLSRITEPTSGRAILNGRVASLLEVGTGFHPELTGRENIYLNGAILGMKRAEIACKFDEIVAFAEIEKFLDTPVKRYSSGMYVRLAFAVAAHLEPEILIVDEVLAVGDGYFQKKCLGKIGEVARTDGRTVLFVSHNMAAVNALCSRAVMIGAGRVKAIGDVSHVVRSYLEEFGDNSLRPEVSLANWSDRYGSAHCRILAGRLRDSRGDLCSTFRRGSPLTVELDVDLDGTHDVHYGATCTSDKGDRVLLLSHKDDPSFNPSQLRGRRTVQFMIPALPLQAGRFSWILSLHTLSMEPLDVVRDVLAFEVQDSPDTPRPYRSESVWGFCSMPARWSIVVPGNP